MGRMAQRAVEREARVTEAALISLEPLISLGPLAGRAVLAGEDTRLAEALGAQLFSRWSVGDRRGEARPPASTFAAATLRLPKSTRAFEMAFHVLSGCLNEEGELYVYGANDEGIRSAPNKLSALYEQVDTFATLRKCRVLRAARPDRSRARTDLADWAETTNLVLDGRARPWITYPGLFAKGGLDAGTALLLEGLEVRGRVLDFGCGTGVSTLGLLERGAKRVDASDADALAVLAARQNVPGVDVHLGDGFGALEGCGPWDVIVSNPPIHRGFEEDFGLLEALISEAPHHTPRLVIVVQRQVPAQESLERAFSKVQLLREDGRFRVWEARRA